MGGLRDNVPWTRFWLPRDVAPLRDGRGYLADPEGPYGKVANPHARTLEQLDDTPCVALLGEPGSGKSYVISAHRDALLAREPGRPVLLFDCRSHRDLDKQLVATAPFQRWFAGAAPLTLLFDSLDEHPLGAYEAAQQLRGHLLNGPLDTLRLRIACRSAEWPAVLDEQLRQMWKPKQGSDEPRAVFYTLAPLRRVDVALAAGECAEPFLDAVAAKDAEPLAMSPVTLRFLLAEYGRERTLPRTRVALYAEGCRVLCEEASKSRQGAKKTGDLKDQQRLAIASRIAAVTVLGRRSLIFTGADVGTVPADAVMVEDLVGRTEPSPLGDVVVDEAAVQEVLGISGLFAARGAECVGWAHQTYAEFLAARFLHERGLALDALVRALSNDTMNRIVPALRETAAWLASMNKGVFARLLAVDPLALLWSDFALIGNAEREALVGALLERMLARDLPAYELRLRDAAIARLGHPRIAEQLRPYVANKSCYGPARRVAIDIAKGCRATGLTDLLIEIALDPTDDIHVRVGAVHMIVHTATDEIKRRLKPLVFELSGSDPDDELKGYALQALWPDDLSAKDLFACLTPRKNGRLYGSYLSFFHDLGSTLHQRHLQEALVWSTSVPPRHAAEQAQTALLDTIFALAWKHIEDPEVCAAFAKAAHHRMSVHDAIFERRPGLGRNEPRLDEDDTRRRLLAAALISLPPRSRYEQAILLPRDARWIVEQMREAQPAIRRRWASVLQQLTASWTVEVLEPLIEHMDDYPELRETMPWLIREVRLGSPESRWMRREARMWRKRSAKLRWREPRRRKLPPAKRRIEECILKYEAGEPDAGWRLHLWLLVDPEDKQHSHEHEWDITEFSGWKGADEGTRARIVEIGKKYLTQTDEHVSEWLGKGRTYRPADAGYRYLCLIDKTEPAWLDGHPEVWQRWAAISIAFALNADEQCKRMTARAYRAQPARILETFEVLLREDHERGDFPFPIYKVEECWDERLGRFLLDFVQRNDLKPRFMGELLDALIAHGVASAAEYARSLISTPVPSATPERLRMRAAAHALMAFAPQVGWTAIRPLVDADPQFPREVFLSFSREDAVRRSKSWAKGLSIAQAMDLYVWMLGQFPHAEDPVDRSRGFTAVTPRHQVAELRDSVLSEVISRGTPEAVAALQQLQREFPARDYTWAIHSAKEAAAQESWVPRSPAEIIALAPAPLPATEPTPMTHDQLTDALCQLLEPELNTLISKLQIPPAYLPSTTAAPATRIGEVLRWAERRGALAEVERRYHEITGRAPPVAAPSPAVAVAAYAPTAAPAPASPAPAAPTPTLAPLGFTFPPPVVEAYRRGDLAVLFGSGLSPTKYSGGPFPTWRELPERLLGQALRFGVLTQAQVDARRAIFTSEPLPLKAMLTELDAIKVALRGARKYQQALDAIFSPSGAAHGDVHRALAELSAELLATTNYDELMEHAEGPPARSVYTWREADNALARIRGGRKVLFKIHGTVDKEQTVVMTRREYDDVARDQGYQQTMRYLLQRYTFLLIGYGINDPCDLDLVFSLNAKDFGVAASPHYALMKGAPQNDVDRWQSSLNVQVVPYASHDDLPTILRALRATKP